MRRLLFRWSEAMRWTRCHLGDCSDILFILISGYRSIRDCSFFSGPAGRRRLSEVSCRRYCQDRRNEQLSRTWARESSFCLSPSALNTKVISFNLKSPKIQLISTEGDDIQPRLIKSLVAKLGPLAWPKMGWSIKSLNGRWCPQLSPHRAKGLAVYQETR